MRKTILLMAAASALCVYAWGASRLKVTLSDGSTPTFLLADKPTVTFPGADVAFATAEATVEYPRSSVVNMEFEDVGAGVESIAAKGEFRYIDGIITAEGPIAVFSVNGTLALSGNGRVSTANLAGGIYVVKTSTHTVKITIK